MMDSVIVTYIDYNSELQAKKINCSDWYNIANDCNYNGIDVNRIVRIEKTIEVQDEYN